MITNVENVTYSTDHLQQWHNRLNKKLVELKGSRVQATVLRYILFYTITIVLFNTIEWPIYIFTIYIYSYNNLFLSQLYRKQSHMYNCSPVSGVKTNQLLDLLYYSSPKILVIQIPLDIYFRFTSTSLIKDSIIW